jgi:hypothetical protein
MFPLMARMHAVGKESVFSAGALRLPCAAEKLAGLVAREKLWAARVGKTQAQFEKLQSELESLTSRMETATQPLIEKCRALDEQLHSVFAQLVSAESSLGIRAREKVKGCYESLQISGFLSDRRPDPDLSSFSNMFNSSCSDAAGAQGFSPFASNDQTSCSEAHKGRDRQASRDLFRKLAEQLHPDKCHSCEDLDDRLRREDAMKEASIAYRQGDLCRLMSIEKAWLHGRAVPRSTRPVDLDARCQAVQARLSDLMEQERTLKRDLQELKQVPEMTLLNDIKRFGEEEVFERLAEDMQAEAEELQESLTFAKKFAAQRITLEHFIRGPGGAYMGDDYEDPFALMRDIEEYLNAFSSPSPPPKRKRKVAPGSKNKRPAAQTR